MLGVAFVAHVVRPGWFLPMVPRWLPGEPRHLHAAATAAEGTAALLLTSSRTARAGGLLALATLVGVYPANLEAVRLGGYRGAPGWLGTRTAAVLRLPLQVPLWAWAWRVAQDARDLATTAD